MNRIKNFFSIKEDKYTFEIFDLTALITVLNVALILMGYWWAPICGLINCVIIMVISGHNRLHINTYITQVALIILNVYFLNM